MTDRGSPTLEYATAPRRGGGAWSVVGLGRALAGFCHVGWIAGQVWWYVSDARPVVVFLNPQWFALPVLGAGVSLVGLWRGRLRGMAACGVTLAAASVVTLTVLRGRW